MATPIRPSRPSTPATQSPSTPGKWRHPQFEEIIRRQQATTFSDQNVSKIVYNVVALFSLWVFQKLAEAYLPLYYLADWFYPFWDYVAYGTSYLLTGVRVIFLYNILVACQPLFRPKDDLSDIPLTPAQRKLLGLEPTSTPPTPGSTYVTPPRYPRTNHTGSMSPGSRSASYSKSPFDSNKRSPFDLAKPGSSSGKTGPSNASPSPWENSYNASPLLHKAMGGARNNLRSQSYGSPSPLGPAGARNSVFDAPGTPSPSNGRGTAAGLNNRWLYERHKASPAPKIFV